MIHFRNISALVVLLAAATLSAKSQTITAADSTGLPGDNFSLEGALELFKKSTSPEEFEKMLNTEDSKVNNLDLNGDGETDYINVIDQTKKGSHAFVLQVAVSENEKQDIAVIELEKTGNDKAVAQIVGDEDMYGEQTIVEPTEEVVTNAGTSRQQVVVNVWTWPSVRYVYAPGYGVWASPYRWRAYPGWWRPWRPIRHRVFYGYRAPYRSRYVVVSTHRVVRAHRVYAPHRVTSVAVHTRHGAAVSHYRTTRTVKVNRGAKRVRTTRTVRTGGRKH
ncbi:MAG: hypothetical protein HOP30_08020 [Cyclobacteriaceae bacterium]|nr:hypothetical protein [Cyclobacteriaceae bacterium]